MAQEKIYVDGLRMFAPNDKAPDWVIGNLIIDIDKLNAFIKANADYLTDYKGSKQLNCNVTKGSKGLSISVDTYRAKKGSEDVPF